VVEREAYILWRPSQDEQTNYCTDDHWEEWMLHSSDRAGQYLSIRLAERPDRFGIDLSVSLNVMPIFRLAAFDVGQTRDHILPDAFGRSALGAGGFLGVRL
jgi:hypothetical protein